MYIPSLLINFIAKLIKRRAVKLVFTGDAEISAGNIHARHFVACNPAEKFKMIRKSIVICF